MWVLLSRSALIAEIFNTVIYGSLSPFFPSPQKAVCLFIDLRSHPPVFAPAVGILSLSFSVWPPCPLEAFSQSHQSSITWPVASNHYEANTVFCSMASFLNKKNRKSGRQISRTKHQCSEASPLRHRLYWTSKLQISWQSFVLGA